VGNAQQGRWFDESVVQEPGQNSYSNSEVFSMRLIHDKARRHVAALLSTACAATALVALTAAAPASLAATPSSAAITGKLVVWDFNEDTPQGKSYPTVDAAFEKMYPGVSIEHVAKPATTYRAVVQAAMAAKAGPDVLMLQTPFAIEQYSQELTPLNSMITPALRKQLEGWDGMNPHLNPNGTIYGLPYSFGATAFYWNKALFKKAGLDPNHIATTYNGLLSELQKLKAAGITPLGGGDKGGVFFSWWMYIGVPGVMNLKACYGLSDGATKWTDPRMATVVKEWLTFVQRGFLASNQQELFAGDFSGFGNWENGNAALVWAFPGYRPILAKDDSTNLGTAAAVIGAGSSKPNFYMAGPTLGWTVPTWSNNKPAAEAYIKFMTGPYAQQLHLNVDGVGPTNVAVNVSKAAPDLRATFNLWKANPLNAHCGRTWNNEVIQTLGQQVAAIEAGTQTIQGALADAQRIQNQIDISK
jgi:ABC-type glycerol-3-phosphate transport system substrate-binding protein